MSGTQSRALARVMAELKERRWNAEDAERVLVAWQETGLSVSQFALEHGLDPQRVWLWRRRLADRFTPMRVKRSAPSGRLVPAVVKVGSLERSVAVRAGEVVVELDAERVSPEWVATLVERLGKA